MNCLELFTEERCNEILKKCIRQFGNDIEETIVKNLEIKYYVMEPVESDTFIKKEECEHVWYRWKRGAKKRLLKDINEMAKELNLKRMHLAYIKYVKNENEGKRKPIVVGKSNSSSTFDLVYTTKVVKDNPKWMNSKVWLHKNRDWVWDVQYLEVYVPKINIYENKHLSSEQKELIYQKIAYAIERFLIIELRKEDYLEIYES